MPDFPPVGDPRADALLGGRVTLLQTAAGYRAAIDPVFLAAAVPDAGWETGLDVGLGTGAATLCTLARVATGHLTGLEQRQDHADLAQRSLALNGLAGRALVVVGDVSGRPAPVPGNAFDLVLTNPPYVASGSRARDPGRASANIEQVPLADWVAFCLRCLRQDGSLVMIHRADRMHEILGALSGRAGATEIVPLWPRAGAPAKRVVVRARKGARAGAVLHPGLVLHEDDGRFTDAAEAVLRHGASLDAAMGRAAAVRKGQTQ